MTQTVSSKAWRSDMDVRAVNFQDTIEPPGRREMFGLSEQGDGSVTTAEPTWLLHNQTALESVMRGLAQEGTIDRGSFAIYAE